MAEVQAFEEEVKEEIIEEHVSEQQETVTVNNESTEDESIV